MSELEPHNLCFAAGGVAFNQKIVHGFQLLSTSEDDEFQTEVLSDSWCPVFRSKHLSREEYKCKDEHMRDFRRLLRIRGVGA